MTFFVEFFLSVCIALTLTLAFTKYKRLSRREPWASFVFLFTVLLLATWAGGLWLGRFGPTIWNVCWLPFGLTGLFLAFLLATTVRRWPSRHRARSKNPAGDERLTISAAFRVFLVLLTLLLGTAVALRYLLP
jgi:hypothetical protein